MRNEVKTDLVPLLATSRSVLELLRLGTEVSSFPTPEPRFEVRGSILADTRLEPQW
jgi:hypothetical protein